MGSLPAAAAAFSRPGLDSLPPTSLLPRLIRVHWCSFVVAFCIIPDASHRLQSICTTLRQKLPLFASPGCDPAATGRSPPATGCAPALKLRCPAATGRSPTPQVCSPLTPDCTPTPKLRCPAVTGRSPTPQFLRPPVPGSAPLLKDRQTALLDLNTRQSLPDFSMKSDPRQHRTPVSLSALSGVTTRAIGNKNLRKLALKITFANNRRHATSPRRHGYECLSWRVVVHARRRF